MSNPKANVVGKAVYMEMRRDKQTTQLILMPEALTEDGKVVPMTMYRRNISSSAPRRAWKQASTTFMSNREGDKFVQLDKVHALETFNERMQHFEPIFRQLELYGYKLYKQPIVVEVTSEDAMDARNSKTPYKVLGRITRCRRALDFGEALYA
jgi:hypothetical protein